MRVVEKDDGLAHRLQRVLQQELKTGCQDRVVMGGLERFIARWRAEAGSWTRDGASRQHLATLADLLAGYAGWPPPERQRRLNQVLALLPQLPLVRAPAPPHPLASPPNPSASPTTAAKSAPSPGRGRPAQSLTLESPIIALYGLRGAQATKLGRLGVRTIGDLFYLFPRRYLDYSQIQKVCDLVPGAAATVVVTPWDISKRRAASGLTVIEALLGDETGTLWATWFRAGREYLTETLRPGIPVVLSGEVSWHGGRPALKSPELEVPTSEDLDALVHTGRLVPVYPLTEGLSQRWLRQKIKLLLDGWLHLVPDLLPADLRQQRGLLELPVALAQAHFPDSAAHLRQAQQRLAFDELFFLQLGVLARRRAYREERPGHPLPADPARLAGFLDALPFTLTGAQQRALDEILADMARPQPMARLLEGEVGSGKTAVAAAAALVAAANGFQAAIMAPTEILAEQHYHTLEALFGGLVPPPRLRLLIGSLKKSAKEEALQALAQGEADIAIGTHALIEEGVEFARLGLVVVDEQHRFGVMQRAALRQKGYHPHLLVMTATPIPRTLALTLYGDLDLSVLDEMPPGRQPIRTRCLSPQARPRAYAFLRQRVAAGEQGFIICPLVEESEKIEAKAATAEHRRLQSEVFPDLKLGLLHGRMSGAEKEATMRRFRDRELQVLVATPVVEVGIDVPNATVMLVEGADRFGLAQLHQFRGRVGRGESPAYCLLVAESPSMEAQRRLLALEHSQNGFELAEEDLRLRGPGEFFGTRQSGMPDLKMAQLTDAQLFQEARAAAQELFRHDPGLEQHQLLAAKVAQFWRSGGEAS